MFASNRNFALKNFFLTCFKFTSGTMLEKCNFKLSLSFLCIMSEIMKHLRHNSIFSTSSWALHGVLTPEILFFLVVLIFRLAMSSQYGHVYANISQIFSRCHIMAFFGQTIPKKPINCRYLEKIRHKDNTYIKLSIHWRLPLAYW